MAGSVNKVILLGNLGADPEVRTTQGGVKIATLSVATSESWRDKSSGEKKEKTEWSRVVVFGAGESDGLAGVAEKYLRKGSKVYLEGKLQTKKWTDEKGVDRWTTEVVLSGFGANLVLLDGKDSSGGSRQPVPPDEGGSRSSGSSSGGVNHDTLDTDDIPF